MADQSTVFMFLRVPADLFYCWQLDACVTRTWTISAFFLLFTPSWSSLTICRRSFILIWRSFSFVFKLRWFLTHVEQGYCRRLATFGFWEAFFLLKYEATCWDVKNSDTRKRRSFWSFLAFLMVNATVSGFAFTPVRSPSLKISSKNSFCFSLNGDLDLHDFSAHPWFSLFCPGYSSNFVSKVRFALKPSSRRFA